MDFMKCFSLGQDAVLATSEDNIQYCTGFYTAARRPAQIGQTAALLFPSKTVLFCPENWSDIAAETVGREAEVVPYRGGLSQLAESISACFATGRICLGFEEDNIDHRLFRMLDTHLDICWMDSSEEFRAARSVKSPIEKEKLRKCAKLASEAMEYATSILRPGKTEWQIMSELEHFMRMKGSAGTPFTIKVLAGDNALRTINLPGEHVLERGEIVLIDMGATLEGYASDWTRSFVLGKPTADQQELYELVFRIERECIAKIRPGLTYDELMLTAFRVLDGHRFEKYFNPFLGHNIGIRSQELPNIVSGSREIFKAGAVVTIEPGIYVPGVGGVRIEDEILINEDGCEILTGLDTERFELNC